MGSAHSSVDLFVVEDPDTDFSSICSEGSESFQSPVEDFQSPVEDSDFERLITKVNEVAEKQGLEEENKAEVSKSEKESREISQAPEEYVDALENQPDANKVDSLEDKKEEVVEEINKEEAQDVKEKEVAPVQKEEEPIVEKKAEPVVEKKEEPIEEKKKEPVEEKKDEPIEEKKE